jgi:predicted Rdx family selenoprotein
VQKNTDIDKPRLGAFEVYYYGKCVYSKIITGLFPVPKQIATRVKQFIDDCKRGKDVSDYPTRKEKR